MTILGIESIVYGVDDMDAAVRFHEDWGLTLREKNAAGADFDLADRTTIHIRAADDPALPPPMIDWAHLNDATARELIWGVEDTAGLEAIGAELARDREVAIGEDGTLHSTDDHGYRIGFRVSKREKVPLELPETNAPDTAQRHNVPAEGATRGRAAPVRFGHMVLWAPGDLAAHVAFYTDRLGFRVTDNVLGAGVFMRCAGSTDHHNLFLQKGGGETGEYLGFQHVAYEIRDFDAVMMLGAHMEGAGWRTNVGPLRHNIGSSMSWYMWNPAGGLAEAYCDMDYADDGWVVRNIDTKDPSFYGSSWNARPEQAGRRPADLN